MFTTIENPYRVIANQAFDVAHCPTQPPIKADEATEKAWKQTLKQSRKAIARLQHRMYAENRQALLLVFQAMDAAGKDSTIRAVTKGINPAGCHVTSFKKPSALELSHDFLWRTNNALPRRGRIGIFNRSYYEETLVVRVHPEFLQAQRLPELPTDLNDLWQQRFTAINSLEKHWVQNGTVVLKFWLNVSKEEQRQRFLSRLNQLEKHWKFSASDIKERGYWDDYMHAYQHQLLATSQNHAPWYAIPADNKLYMRKTVAEIILQTLQQMNPQFPAVKESEKAMFAQMRALLNK